MTPRPLRDVDSAGRMQKLHAAVWALIGSTIFGLLGAFLYGLVGFFLGWVIGFVGVYLGTMMLAETVGRTVSTIYMATGAGTPAQREYSLGDALAAQGRLADAVSEFERNAAAYSDDPEPRLRLARLYRDRLAEPEQAARWFKQALAVPALDSGIEGLAARELVELYTRKLNQPERALPILARLTEHQPSSPHGVWARTELTELKRQLHSNP